MREGLTEDRKAQDQEGESTGLAWIRRPTGHDAMSPDVRVFLEAVLQQAEYAVKHESFPASPMDYTQCQHLAMFIRASRDRLSLELYPELKPEKP